MSAASHDPVCRLVTLGSSSLLQYVSESFPWSARNAASAIDAVVALAHEEGDAVAKLSRWLQKQHVRQPAHGAYPSHFTTMNFVAIDYLLPRLIAENERELAEVERIASRAEDDEDHQVVQGFLEMKRRHLQTLKDLTATPAAV